MPAISNTPRPGYAYDSTDDVWYPIGTGPHTHDYAPSGGVISPTVVDAKGDIITATAADTPARIAVGSNGQLLAANSATATGLEWQTVSSGGMTLLNTTTFNNTTDTYTFSSLGSHKHLLLVIDQMNTSAGGSVSNFALRLNGVTSADYNGVAWGFRGAQTFNVNNIGPGGIYFTIQDICANSTQPVGQRGHLHIWFWDYNGSGTKTFDGQGASNSGTSAVANTFSGLLNTTNAITSITIFNEQANNFNNGTVKIYGVS